MICAILVNTQTNRQLSTGYSISSAIRAETQLAPGLHRGMLHRQYKSQQITVKSRDKLELKYIVK